MGGQSGGGEEEDAEKIMIPLDDASIQKAKACQEMIMFEREGMGVSGPEELKK
jgi:hypothetical protein